MTSAEGSGENLNQAQPLWHIQGRILVYSYSFCANFQYFMIQCKEHSLVVHVEY